MRQSHHPVNEVSVCANKLVVYPIDVFVPTEVGVVGLWHVDREVVPEGVRVVLLQVRR